MTLIIISYSNLFLFYRFKNNTPRDSHLWPFEELGILFEFESYLMSNEFMQITEVLFILFIFLW